MRATDPGLLIVLAMVFLLLVIVLGGVLVVRALVRNDNRSDPPQLYGRDRGA